MLAGIFSSDLLHCPQTLLRLSPWSFFFPITLRPSSRHSPHSFFFPVILKPSSRLKWPPSLRLLIVLLKCRIEECSSYFCTSCFYFHGGISYGVHLLHPQIRSCVRPTHVPHSFLSRRSNTCFHTCPVLWKRSSWQESWCHWGASVGFPSPRCLRAPPEGATDAGLLLDTRPRAAWTTRLPRARSYISLEHWLQKLLF